MKLNQIFPIDEKAIIEALSFDKIYFFEEGVKVGGIAESFLASLVEKGYKGKYKIFAIENKFIPHMSVDEALDTLGFSEEAIYNLVLNEEGE